jgi:hypothetical protein
MEKCYKVFLRDDTTISAAACHPLIQPIRMTVRTRGTRPTRLDRAASLLFLNIRSGQFTAIHVGQIHKWTYLVVFADLADQIGKCLIHINSLFSRCLNKATPEMLSKVATLYVVDEREMRETLVSDGVEETYHSCQPAAQTPDRTYWRRQ